MVSVIFAHSSRTEAFRANSTFVLHYTGLRKVRSALESGTNGSESLCSLGMARKQDGGSNGCISKQVILKNS